MTFFKTALTAICLTLLACAASDTIVESETSATSPIVIGKSFKLASDITGESHEINVWTPPDMGKDDKTHPVLYVIDGGLDQDFQHIAGLAQLASISNRFETPIVVGIRTANRNYQLTAKARDPRYIQFNDVVGGADEFHNYIIKDVIPFIETQYPNNEHRIIMGQSLGGFFVTREFLRHPDSFTDYIAISPSLWLDDQYLAKEASALLRTHKDTPRQLYFTMANEGGTMQAGMDKVLEAIKAQNFEALNMIYVDRRDTDTHSTIYHGAALDALTQLFGIPAPDHGPDPWYLRIGGQPEEDAERQ